MLLSLKGHGNSSTGLKETGAKRGERGMPATLYKVKALQKAVKSISRSEDIRPTVAQRCTVFNSVAYVIG